MKPIKIVHSITVQDGKLQVTLTAEATRYLGQTACLGLAVDEENQCEAFLHVSDDYSREVGREDCGQLPLSPAPGKTCGGAQ
jgi:transcriptional regulator of met regulon